MGTAEARLEQVKSEQARPELKELVREASEALARLDAGRLEELAQCCRALNRDWSLQADGAKRQQELARQAREAAGEFVIFTRVLRATRANLDVMARLRGMSCGMSDERLEY